MHSIFNLLLLSDLVAQLLARSRRKWKVCGSKSSHSGQEFFIL